MGTKPDCILNDKINLSIDSDDYIPDEPLPRQVKDKTLNNFGIQLLDICKATDLRICNGRLDDDGAYTYYGPNGCSTIDYLLCRPCDFWRPNSFNIKDFTVFSDHAMLEFSIPCNTMLRSD